MKLLFSTGQHQIGFSQLWQQAMLLGISMSACESACGYGDLVQGLRGSIMPRLILTTDSAIDFGKTSANSLRRFTNALTSQIISAPVKPELNQSRYRSSGRYRQIAVLT
jgi:hypothetical protein